MRHPLLLLFAVVVAAAAQTYNGPRPEKPDLPYLKHADKLVPTEAAEASRLRSESRKLLMAHPFGMLQAVGRRLAVSRE